MRIAIIGGGIFGTNVAITLSKNKNVNEIVIFEKKDRLFSEASTNNQHRYHLGYHYPRSEETIKQILFTNELFDKVYGNCTYEIKNNIYFISKYESLINSNLFYNLFSKYNQDIQYVDLKKYKNFVNIDNIESGFLVKERGINTKNLCDSIYQKILNNKKIKLIFNSHIEKKEELSSKFNFIINTSYFDISITNNIDVKYEVCLLPLLKNPLRFDNFAFTVMDGNFPSLYPTQQFNIFTLSHVLKTPIYKTDNKNSIKQFRENLTNLEILNYAQDIVKDSKIFYNLNNVEFVNFYLSYKIKTKNDLNDIRTSKIIYDKNIITILQGKITTCTYVAEEIDKYVKNYNNR